MVIKAEDLKKWLQSDIDKLDTLPDFQEIATVCTRQLCRAQAMAELSMTPGEGIPVMGMSSVTYLMDAAAKLANDLLIVIGKLYQEKNLPTEFVVDPVAMMREEAQKFGATDPFSEEEGCQVSESEESKKLLN